jgi:hypothetical protein
MCRNRIARNSSPSFGGAERAWGSVACLEPIVNSYCEKEGIIATKERKEHKEKPLF